MTLITCAHAAHKGIPTEVMVAMSKRRRAGTLVSSLSCGLALLLVLTACGSSTPNKGQGNSSGSGTTTIDLGTIPIASAIVPIVMAQNHGYFKSQHIEVKYHLLKGGAAVVPTVMSGQYQIGFSNNVSLIIARAKGLPLQIVTCANSAGKDPQPIEEALLVEKNGPIKSLKDLEGKTVAVNTLDNIVQLADENALEKAGVDIKKVKFVEVGFPDMPTALKQGKVQAADIADPFKTEAIEQGAKIIAKPFRVVQPNLYISSWFSTKNFIDTHRSVVSGFVKALDQGKKYATDHPKESRALAAKLLKLNPDLAQKMAFGPVPPGMPSKESLQKLHDLAVKDGVIKQSQLPNVDVLLGSGS